MLLVVWCLVWSAVPSVTEAILPPDLIFNTGIQLGALLTGLVVTVSGMLSAAWWWGRAWVSRYPAIVAGGVIMVLIVGSSVLVRVVSSPASVVPTAVAEPASAAAYPNLSATCAAADIACIRRTPTAPYEFLSDVITVHNATTGVPFSLQLHVLRERVESGQVRQTVYLQGWWNGEYIQEQSVLFASTTEPQPQSVLRSFTRRFSPDNLYRDSYHATIAVPGAELDIVIPEATGDFITRAEPSYSRYYSVVMAEVRGATAEPLLVPAVVRGIHTSDARVHIFFPGREALVATTYQFIVWDEAGRWYMIDESDVQSPTAHYPSHTWVLHADTARQVRQKSFRAEIESAPPGYVVHLPEVDDARFYLQHTNTSAYTSRQLHRVQGYVQDAAGSRQVIGIVIIDE